MKSQWCVSRSVAGSGNMVSDGVTSTDDPDYYHLLLPYLRQHEYRAQWHEQMR